MNNLLFPFYQTFIHKTGKIDHTQVQLLRNQNSYLYINSEIKYTEVKKKKENMQLQFVYNMTT